MTTLSQTAANVALADGTEFQNITEEVIAGGTITQGNSVYRDTSDNTWKQARANAASTAGTKGNVGIALTKATSGNKFIVQKSGGINVGATLTVGETYGVAADAAGGIAPIADIGSTEYVTNFGVAVTTSALEMKPQASATAKP